MSQVKKKNKKNRFFKACAKGNFNVLLAAIEKADSRDETKLFTWRYQNQPLHFAAAYGDLDVVRTLIEKYNYDAECRNNEGVTPLHFACLGGHAQVVDYLLKERQCDPNVLDTQNASPLHYVCYSTYDNLKQPQRKLRRYHGRVASHDDNVNFYYVEMLTRVCLVASAETMYYNTAMKLHYSRGQISIARNLMLHEGSPSAETSSNQQPMLLELACQCGSLEDLQYFIGMCTDSVSVQAKLTSLLCIACNYERVEIFVFLVKNYISQGMKLPNGSNILMLACSAGNLSIIKCIIELNIVSVTLELINEVADNKANSCTLKLLVENLHEKPTSLMEDSNMPYQQFTPRFSNSHSNTFKLLQASLEKNNFELMKAIINESTITSKDGDGNTPLHWMCNSSYRRSNLQFVKYLLSLVDNDPSLSGANVANHKGELPLHIACLNDKVDIVRLVSPQYDHINLKDHNGNTALHVACTNKTVSIEIIQYLVELGIDSSCQNNKRELPLHMFCKKHCGPRIYYSDFEPHNNPDNETIVKLALLCSQPKFDIDTQDISDQTPLHIICGKIENVEIVKYLTQEKKCDQNIQNSKHQLALHIVADLKPFNRYLTHPNPEPDPRLMEMAKLVSGHPTSTFNVNAPDEDGNTPLHIACRNINFELIQYLVNDKQCDQSIQNKRGQLPLHIILGELRYANDKEQLIMIVKVSKLVSSQPNLNIDAQDQDGNTPLHIVCKHRNFELICYLTQEKECKQNVPNSRDRLPLHIIIGEMQGTRDDCDMSALLSMVRLVSSQSELDFHTQDCDGYTPLHIACEIEAKEVIKYLVFERKCIPTEHSDNKLYSTLNIHVACMDKDDISLLRLLATEDNVNNQRHKSYQRLRAKSAPLHVACENENLTAVKLLLQLGCDLNVKNGKEELPLHIACQKGLLGLVELMADCDVNSIDHDGQTPLHIACFCKHIVIVQFLIENKHANPHLQARYGDTILHSACRSGATEIIRYLLIKIDVCDSDMLLTKFNVQQQYPFHIACTKSLELVKMTTPNFTSEQLISTVDEVLDFNCLHLASSHGLVDVVEYLVEQGCSPFTEDKYGINALGSACGLREYSLKVQPSKFNNHYYYARTYEKHICPNVVKYLVSKCFLDPTQPQGRAAGGYVAAVVKCPSLFEHACQLQNLELMKALTVANINWIDSNGNTPLHIACEFEQIDMVKYLVQQGCNLRIQNNKSELALHLAASKSVEMVELLDQSDPDVQCSYGDTALHIACRNNKEHIVTHLVQQRRCNTSIKNSAGELPIHIACRSSKDSNIILRCLVDANHSDTSVRNGVGKLPLHIASELGSIKHLEILSNQKSYCINDIDFDGNTALHLACKGTDLHVIEWLIEHGAKHDTQNKKGNTPAHLCIEHSHQLDSEVIKHNIKALEHLYKDSNEPALCNLVSLYTIARPLIASCSLIQNSNGDLLIHLACRLNTFEVTIIHAHVLLLSKEDTFEDSLLVQNAQGDTPLHIALRTISTRPFKLIPSCTKLIQNNEGDLPIHIACRVKNDEIIYHLSKQDTFEDSLLVQNAQGDTPLHIALQAKFSNTSTDILKLVTTSANCNAQNKLGNTPLHLICMSKSFHHNHYLFYKKHLFELGCDIHLVNSNGQLPLHIAVMHSWAGKMFLNMLLDPIDMITYQDKAGNTPLHLACQQVMVYRNEDSETTCKYLVAKLKDCTKKERISGVSTFSNLLAVINQGNANGDTPLHLAIQSGDENLVQYLVNCKFCNFTKQNKYGQTALHIACSKSSLKMVQMVCSSIDIGSSDLFGQVNANSPENSGLIFPGDTPLHIACRVENEDIVVYLIKEHPASSKAAMAIPNAQNELPIHLCCSRYDPYTGSMSGSLFKLIMEFSKMFANSQTQSKDTVLHIVCKNPYCSRVLTYLVKTIHCDVTIPNCDGDLPLHLICRNTEIDDLLSNLERVVKFNTDSVINAQNNHGNTPLHEVCKRKLHADSYDYYYDDDRNSKYLSPYNIMQEIVKYLLDQGCNKELSNNDQETALHLACQYQTLSVVKLLFHRGVLSVSKEGNSILHHACLNETRNYETNNSYAYDIVCHLAVETPQLFDRLVHNCNKETPLHFACKKNNFEVVKCLLSKGADVSHADINGQTPITLATDPAIIRLLLEHGADPTPLYDLHKDFFQHTTSLGAPPPTPLKVLVIGDPGAGKTTLVESLKNEDGDNITQTEAFGHTAGVIPNDFSSKNFGEVTMYDFAGHSEYYSSHGGVIHSIIKNSPPVIMVLVNLTKDISEIRERALYWTKFVLDYCASLEGKPHLFLLGSHADVLKGSGGNPTSKTKDLIKVIEVKLSTKPIVVKSALSIDCTQSQSPDINILRQHLKESAMELRDKTVLKFSSHCLYVFMQQHFRDQPAVRLDYLLSTLSRPQSSLNQELQSASRDKNSTSIIGFLPTDLEKVAQMCEELSKRGHVLFIKHPQTSLIKQSWIILKKDILLRDVAGRLFAPPDLPEHIQSLANSTGVVPFSKLKQLPCDPNLLTGFLTHMEYCKEIVDPETLQLLDQERSSDSSLHPDSQILDEKYFFFPTLVSVERPCEVWKPDKPNFTYQCGLMLERDLEQEDFFNPQFIQVLLLRLAFTYAVKPTKKKKRREYGDGVRVHDIVERRVCTVWKSGLHWLERSGIETLVDVIDNNKILILMQCLDNVRIKCLKRRSEILSTIMTTKMKLCPNPQITPYLLNPKSIQHPLPPLSEVSLFTMDDINATIEESEGTLIINDSKDCLEQNELLFFEPYAHLCETIVKCFFNRDSSALEEVVPDDFLHHVCHHLSPCYNHVVELISKNITQSGHMSASVSSSAPSIPTEKLFQMFKVWQRRQPQNSGGTYLELRSLFSEVSLFPSLGSTPTGACCDNYHGPRISDIDFDDDDSDNLDPTDKTCQGHLSIKDLKQVRSEIWEVRADWEDLGIELDLDPSSLKVISKECSNKVSACFTEMLTIWLKGEGRTKPTWLALVEALKSETVNHPRLAEDLMKNLTSKGLL